MAEPNTKNGNPDVNRDKILSKMFEFDVSPLIASDDEAAENLNDGTGLKMFTLLMRDILAWIVSTVNVGCIISCFRATPFCRCCFVRDGEKELTLLDQHQRMKRATVFLIFLFTGSCSSFQRKRCLLTLFFLLSVCTLK